MRQEFSFIRKLCHARFDVTGTPRYCWYYQTGVFQQYLIKLEVYSEYIILYLYTSTYYIVILLVQSSSILGYVCQRNVTQVNVRTHIKFFFSALFGVVVGCFLKYPLMGKWLGKIRGLQTMGTRQELEMAKQILRFTHGTRDELKSTVQSDKNKK